MDVNNSRDNLTYQEFDGKVAIVTGGAAGFGEAIARRLVEAGARVVIADINYPAAAALASELPECIAVEVDLSIPEQIQAMIARTADTFGHVDILVNNAGVPHLRGPMIDQTAETFDRIFAINVRGMFLTIKYAHRLMAEQSSIINIASLGAKRPRPGIVLYNASKGAVVTLTKGLAVELAPRIRVCAVLPTGSQTGFIEHSRGVNRLSDEEERVFAATIPMGRMAEPADVAEAVAFLASSKSSFLTGVCLDVDGGRSIQ